MWLTECRGKKEPEQKVKIEYKTDTTYVYHTDTIRGENIPVPYGVPYYIEVPADVDTVFILKDYYARYYYHQVLLDNDTIGYIEVNDSVTQNKTVWRDWKYVNKTPTQIITNITTITDCKKWNMGLGGFFGGNLERFDYGLGIIVTTNNRASYQAEYCFSDKSVRVGCYYNLRK
jgi:hypothetical protein